MRIVGFVNEKGGTGKTTLAVNYAAWLAIEKKQRVLLVDLDSQGHAGKTIGVDVRAAPQTTAELLLQARLTVAEVAQPTGIERLSLVPGNKRLAELPERLAHAPDRELRLQQKLDAAEGFDVVVIDAPPSPGVAARNVLRASREVVIPVACTYLALDGCAELAATVEELAGGTGRPKISAVVPTMYRRSALADAVIEKLREVFPRETTKTVVAMNVQIDEAQSHGRSVFEYAPWSRGAQLLEAAYEELWRRGRR